MPKKKPHAFTNVEGQPGVQVCKKCGLQIKRVGGVRRFSENNGGSWHAFDNPGDLPDCE